MSDKLSVLLLSAENLEVFDNLQSAHSETAVLVASMRASPLHKTNIP